MPGRLQAVGMLFGCLALAGLVAGAPPAPAAKGRSTIGRVGQVATRKAPARASSSLIQSRTQTIPVTVFTPNPQPIPDNPGLLARKGTALNIITMPHLNGTSLLDRKTTESVTNLALGNSLTSRVANMKLLAPDAGSSLLDRTTTLTQRRAGVAPGTSLLDQRSVSDTAQVLIANPAPEVAGLSTPQFGRSLLLRNSTANTP